MVLFVTCANWLWDNPRGYILMVAIITLLLLAIMWYCNKRANAVERLFFYPKPTNRWSVGAWVSGVGALGCGVFLIASALTAQALIILIVGCFSASYAAKEY